MMTNSTTKFSNPRVYLSLIFAALGATYFEYVRFDTMLGRDDNLLVPPITRLTSLSQYFDWVRTNEILDTQPLRDLTFYFNVLIQRWTGFSSFHLTNLLIFFVSIFLVSKLLRTLNLSPKRVIWGTAAYAFHPLMVSAVGWVSARKHSLALVFVLLALIEFFRKRDVTWKCGLFLFLSSLAHQIFFLTPLWLFIYARKKNWPLSMRNLSITVVLISTVVALASYKHFYVNAIDARWFEEDSFVNVSRYILSLGRTTVLIFFPASISAFYHQGSFWNLLGIPLLTVLAYASVKGRSDSSLWVLLGFFAHLPTYIAFVNDTYLYLPLVCSIVALMSTSTAASWVVPRRGIVVGAGLAVALLGLKTLDAALMWRSPQRLWSYSYRNEPSPHNAIGLSGYLADKRESVKLLEWGGKNFNFNHQMNLLPYFLSSVYAAPVAPDERTRILRECFFDHPLYRSYLGLSLLSGTSADAMEGRLMLAAGLNDPRGGLEKEQRVFVARELARLCQRSPLSGACQLSERQNRESHE